MKERIVTAFVTVVIFGAGLCVGIWAGRQRALPAPPMQYMEEFGGNRGGPGFAQPHGPVDRARLAEDIERLRPQINIYQTRLAEIDSDFERDLQGILTADQRAIRAERIKRRQENMEQMNRNGERRAFSDEEIWRLRQPSLRFFRMVVPTSELDELTRDLKLDDTQRGRVLDLLHQRRDKFLALVDQVPAPSVLLSRFANQVQRLEQPKPPPGPQQ
jgi:hypothetical protein